MAMDYNLMLKASGALTETTTGASVDFGAGDQQPLVYVVTVTACSGTSKTLDLTIQESAAADTGQATYLTVPQITATGQYFVTGVSDRRYRNYVATIGGTTPSFTFSVGVDLAGRYTSY